MLAMNSLSKHYRLTELQNALVLARENAGEKDSYGAGNGQVHTAIIE